MHSTENKTGKQIKSPKTGNLSPVVHKVHHSVTCDASFSTCFYKSMSLLNYLKQDFNQFDFQFVAIYSLLVCLRRGFLLSFLRFSLLDIMLAHKFAQYI